MGAAKKKVGPPRKNPNCPLELERLELGETLEVKPQEEYLLEVATRLPLTPRQLADEIRARGAGLRAVSIMRQAPSWWPVLDTNSAYHLHLVFEGKEPQLFPLPGKVKRMWLVRLPPREATPTAPQLPEAVSPPEQPEAKPNVLPPAQQ